MVINYKTILFSSLGFAVVGGAAWYLINKTKKAKDSGNAIADVQNNETVSNFISNITDYSMVSLGIGTPRGIKNNNPLNIKWSVVNNWQGQTGADSAGYSIFATPVDGIRAAAKILKSYAAINVVSIDQIIKRWTSGDSTKIQANYINHVVGDLGIPANAPLNSNNYAALLSSMTYFENGQNPYPLQLFATGVTAAGF